jgi:hypothetical protein
VGSGEAKSQQRELMFNNLVFNIATVNKITIFCALVISFVLFQGTARDDIDTKISVPDKKLNATVDIVLDT